MKKIIYILVGVLAWFSCSAYSQCSMPQRTDAQLAETGDDIAISAMCYSGNDSTYVDLFNIVKSDWRDYGAELLGVQETSFFGVKVNWCAAPGFIGMPLQRLLAAIWTLDKSRLSSGYDSPVLDDYFQFAQAVTRPRLDCRWSGSGAISYKSRTMFPMHTLYDTHVVVRAATIVHERTHYNPSKPHIGGMGDDITVLTPNGHSCYLGDFWDCDIDWSYRGAWMREAVWHSWYANEGGTLMSTAAGIHGRRIATDEGNWVLNSAFVRRPMSGGRPIVINCNSCPG